MAGRSASCSAGTCDERRPDHDHGGRHGRPRLPRARRRRSAACAARHRRVARHAARARSARGAAAGDRRRVDLDHGRARPRSYRVARRAVPHCRRRAADLRRAAPPPPRGGVRHGRVRRGTGRRRRVARAQAAGAARAERGGRHDEPVARAARGADLHVVPGHVPAVRARRGDRHARARARSRRPTCRTNGSARAARSSAVS